MSSFLIPVLPWRQTVASRVTWSHGLYDHNATRVYRPVDETLQLVYLSTERSRTIRVIRDDLSIQHVQTGSASFQHVDKHILHASLVLPLFVFIFENPTSAVVDAKTSTPEPPRPLEQWLTDFRFDSIGVRLDWIGSDRMGVKDHSREPPRHSTLLSRN